MARPERFEVPTYCSGVILGPFARSGSEWQALANYGFASVLKSLNTSPTRQLVATLSATVEGDPKPVPKADRQNEIFQSMFRLPASRVGGFL
jgi:hypothetical protein